MTDQTSILQTLRMKETQELPKILTNLSSLEAKEFIFNNQKIVRFVPSHQKTQSTPKNVGVVFSGGQAAGGHNVIIGLFEALKKLHPESRLFGFLGGPSGLIKNTHVELKEAVLSRYLNQGGFDLIGSDRTKIETTEQFSAVAKTIQSLNLDALCVIGGDDSHTNAALLADYFTKEKIKTQVIGVPKTIDGDLQHEAIEIPFGFDTACKTYSDAIGSIARDALSAKKYYYFVKLMGRSASHITLECALETHPNFTLISEEIERDQKTIHQIVSEISDMVTERAAQNKDYGVVLIPEGVLEYIGEMKLLISELNRILANQKVFNKALLSEKALKSFLSIPEDIQEQLLQARDPHGNVQVSKIETEQFFIELVEKELKARQAQGLYNGRFNPQGIFCGYEGRSCFPSIFDSRYCYALGHTAALLIEAGLTGYTAAVQNLAKNVDDWQVAGVPIANLIHMEERHGQLKAVVKKTFVDLDGPVFKSFAEQRDSWQLLDDYIYPGPIQFYGPSDLTDRITHTLALKTDQDKQGS